MTRLSNHAQKKIINDVGNDAKPNLYFFIMVLLSCTVATYGLLSNSTAVVIGAMLIAPLMGPILGGALAITIGDGPIMKLSVQAEVAGSVIAVAFATILTLLLPSAELTPEILARTSPSILDLVIALASGAAGTYAICKKTQGATLPGVAIATALMPPLCVVGIGLAKQNFSVVSGALLLFLANMVAINVAAIAMFEIVGLSRLSRENVDDHTDTEPITTRRFIYPLVLLIAVSIPLLYIMQKTYDKAHIEKVIKTTLTESLQVFSPHSTVLSADFSDQGANMKVGVAVRTTTMLNPEQIRQMENLLELRLGKPVQMSADVVLVQKVDDKNSIDTFRELLPKIKEKEVIEIVKSSTPEEIVEQVVNEKLSLLPGAKLEDYVLEYRRGSGTYFVTIKIASQIPMDEKVVKTIQSILEERMKRRVEVKTETVLQGKMKP